MSDQVVSRKFLIGAIVGMLMLVVLIHIGFSKTYLQFFPTFDGFAAIQHFHGMMMMGWVLMLVIQPILILKKQTKLHRRLGMGSYVLAPLLLSSIYLVIQSRYLLYIEKGGQSSGVIAWLSLNFRMMLFFTILYALAIYYRKNTALHMRFMCSTALLLIGPALVRMLMTIQEVSRADSHSIDRNINVLIVAVVAVTDSWRTKRLSAFALLFVFMVLQKILWDHREAPVLQTIGCWISILFSG